jgi:hypothetical protein
LKLKKKAPGIQFKKRNGDNQPPKKNITIIVAINNILLYSPKKNIAKIIDEYSTLYPATNSASASGKSNGARFVSANIEIKNIMAQGNKGKTNHTVRSCAAIISVKFKEPASKITGKIKRPKETSYEIICAADLRAPRKAYLELLAHPAIMIPYTFKPETAKRNKTP